MSHNVRRVVCASCRYGETVLAGPRHWDGVMLGQYERLRPYFPPDRIKELRREHSEEVVQ